METTKLTNEQIIRNLYEVAEQQDGKKFASLFTDDGYSYDIAVGQKYYGENLRLTVDIYAKAFPDMHREIFEVYTDGDCVIVELSLNGTHSGPLEMPTGTIPPTGKTMETPCCDVFRLRDGKVSSFHCYAAGTIMMKQLGLM